MLIGFKLSCLRIDVLHTMDQGTTSHIAANIMWHVAIIKNSFGGGNQAEKIANLDKYLLKWYQQVNHKRRIQGQLTLERLRTQNGWPKLKAKAAATRHIVRFSLSIAERWSSGSLHDQLVIAINQLIARVYKLFETSGQIFTEGVKK